MSAFIWFFLSFSPAALIQLVAGPEEAKNLAGKCPPPDSDPFSDGEFVKNLASLSRQFAARASRRFKFDKRSQLFIRVHNKTLSVAAMCVNNPDPDDVKDVLGKYERLEKLAESFFEAHHSWIRSCRINGTHGQKMAERIVD